MGIIATCKMEMYMVATSTLTVVCSSNRVMIGVRSGARAVLTAVTLTEKATSPLPKYVMSSLAVPPGQVPRSTSPAIRTASSSSADPMQKAVSGMMTY